MGNANPVATRGGGCLFKYTTKMRYDKRKSALSDIFYLKIGVYSVGVLDAIALVSLILKDHEKQQSP